MNVKGHYIDFRWFRKWVGIRWSNYDTHQGFKPPYWSGFHLYLGWFALMYHQPRRPA